MKNSIDQTTKIGFVGLGRMGSNMVRRVKDLGYQVAGIYDRDDQVTKSLAKELGCSACGGLAEITAHCDVIFTVVTNDQAMRDIFLSADDHLLVGAKDKVFINCATLSPAVQRVVEAAANIVGAQVVEACMASSISHAREGKLYLMLGGEKEVVDHVMPLLAGMSLKCQYIGKMGKAAEIKALVNMVMNMNTAALAEGLGLAQALGHDLTMVREVFAQTGANSRVLETDGGDMMNREHECWFSAEHAAKDSGIAKSLAEQVGLELPLNGVTYQQYQQMIQFGLGQLDKSGIAELTFPQRTKHA